MCPLCNSLVPIKKGETPDVIVGRHIDNDCKSDTAQQRRKVSLSPCASKIHHTGIFDNGSDISEGNLRYISMFSQFLAYRKNSKNWDTLNYYRDCPTNGIVGFYSAILRSKDADRITNRVDTDQTAP